MRRVKALLIVGLLGILLTACVFSEYFDGSRIGNESQLVAEYTMLNGTDSQDLPLKKGDVIEGEIVNYSGRLKVKIQKEGEPPIYESENVPEGKFTVEVDEDGVYCVTVTGIRARGSLSFVKQEK